MARIIRIISVIFSCCACAAMIWFSSKGNNDTVFSCIIACIVSFFVNMMVAAHENAKKLEALQKQQEAEQAQE